MSTRAFLAIGMGPCLSTAVASAAIIQVDPNTLSTIDIEDFEGFAGGEPPGTNYDNIIEGIGISFAERFVGQMLSFNGDFDVITGTPDDPVSLQVGDPNDNLAIFVFSGSQVLVGLGPDGFPKASALGEGAVAILFAIDHFELGLDIVGESGDGPATFDFFRRDGSLIDSLTFVVKGGPLAFRQDGNTADIAGLVITNLDAGGLGYDNIRYNVPTPGTIALLAWAGIARSRRRRS